MVVTKELRDYNDPKKLVYLAGETFDQGAPTNQTQEAKKNWAKYYANFYWQKLKNAKSQYWDSFKNAPGQAK